MKKRNDFIIANGRRCGTESLLNSLVQHPYLNFQKRSLLGVFAKDEIFERGYPNSLKSSSHLGEAHDRIGDFSSDYLVNANCLSRIFHHNPQVKILAILRNPAERAFSEWHEAVDKGTETRSFLNAIEEEQQLITNASISPPSGYLRRSLYGRQIEGTFQYFNPHQVLLVNGDDFKNDVDVVLYQIQEFLEVPYLPLDNVASNLGNYNESLSAETYNDVLPYFAKDISLIESLLGWKCDEWKSKRSTGAKIRSLVGF